MTQTTSRTNGPAFHTKYGVMHGDTTRWSAHGLDFEARIYHDEMNSDAPWEQSDGHGPVSDWRDKDSKRAGERILNSDRWQARFYDFEEATRIAKRDGWGLGPEDRQKLAEKLGREPTKGEIRAAAVEKDFEFLRGWCNDEWYYVGVGVTVSYGNVELVGEYDHAVWGVESIAGDYLNEMARDIASEALETARERLEEIRVLNLPGVEIPAARYPEQVQPV